MYEQKKDILTVGFTAGSRAIDNYDKCCELFGFKRASRGSFASQKPLYAKNATVEGYSVWMLAHSSLNENYIQAKSSYRKWFNIFDSENTIKEIWFKSDEYVKDTSIRICFAKDNTGKYFFKGVYKPVKETWEILYNGKTEWVRTFEKISNVYPIGNNTITRDISTPETPPVLPETNDVAEIDNVIDNCKIKAIILETKKDTTVIVDVKVRPFQKALIGKMIGDTFTLPNVKLTYQIQKILIEK